MYCSNCGKEIFDKEENCQHCGNKISINLQTESQQNCMQGKVIIHSYEDFYLICPNVNIYIDGNLITSLPRGKTFEYNITKTTTICFKCSFRTATITVNPNAITEIQLIFERFTGNLEVVRNEQNFNGINNTDPKVYQAQINSRKKTNDIVFKVVLGIMLITGILEILVPLGIWGVSVFFGDL